MQALAILSPLCQMLLLPTDLEDIVLQTIQYTLVQDLHVCDLCMRWTRPECLFAVNMQHRSASGSGTTMREGLKSTHNLSNADSDP